jgi:hypothetical protein
VITQHLPEGETLEADFNVWECVGKVNVYLRDVGPTHFAAMNEE